MDIQALFGNGSLGKVFWNRTRFGHSWSLKLVERTRRFIISSRQCREAATVALNLYRECFGVLRGKCLARCAIILWSALVLCDSSAFAQQKVGFVLEMHGKWSDGDAQGFLKLGQLLPGEAVLSNVAPVDDDRIVIANLHGEIIKTVRCKDEVCRECTE